MSPSTICMKRRWYTSQYARAPPSAAPHVGLEGYGRSRSCFGPGRLKYQHKRTNNNMLNKFGDTAHADQLPENGRTSVNVLRNERARKRTESVGERGAADLHLEEGGVR